jgi:hypothetical protein
MKRIINKVSIEKVLDRFPPMQHREEFLWMWDNLPELEYVLETGMGWGATAALFAFSGAQVITIDPKPEEAWVFRDPEYLELVPWARPVKWINRSSLDIGVLKYVNDKRYSLLHIDGDHSKEACYYDWNTYGPLADLIAVHDIYGWENSQHDREGWGPRHLWHTLDVRGHEKKQACLRHDGGIGITTYIPIN